LFLKDQKTMTEPQGPRLAEQPGFQALPQRTRDWILQSPHASAFIAGMPVGEFNLFSNCGQLDSLWRFENGDWGKVKRT
jgi:hypothetical protein